MKVEIRASKLAGVIFHMMKNLTWNAILRQNEKEMGHENQISQDCRGIQDGTRI